MKVLVLSTVRTRSSYLLDCISKFYKLENLYEHYTTIQFEAKTFNKFQDIVENKTKIIMDQSEVGVKIHPTNFINMYKYHQNVDYEGPWNVNSIDDFIPVTKFQIDQYDKIFILTRTNFIDLYCSWITGLKSNKLLYTQLEKNLIDKNSEPFSIKLHKKIAKILLFDVWFLDNCMNYLPIDESKVIRLDYNNVKDYTNNNFPNIRSKYLETNFDYQKLITNYNEIEKGLIECQKEFSDEFNHRLFSK